MLTAMAQQAAGQFHWPLPIKARILQAARDHASKLQRLQDVKDERAQVRHTIPVTSLPFCLF